MLLRGLESFEVEVYEARTIRRYNISEVNSLYILLGFVHESQRKVFKFLKGRNEFSHDAILHQRATFRVVVLGFTASADANEDDKLDSGTIWTVLRGLSNVRA